MEQLKCVYQPFRCDIRQNSFFFILRAATQGCISKPKKIALNISSLIGGRAELIFIVWKVNVMQDVYAVCGTLRCYNNERIYKKAQVSGYFLSNINSCPLLFAFTTPLKEH